MYIDTLYMYILHAHNAHIYIYNYYIVQKNITLFLTLYMHIYF